MKKHTVYIISLVITLGAIWNNAHGAAVERRTREYERLLQEISDLSSRRDVCLIEIECNKQKIEFKQDYINFLKKWRESEEERKEWPESEEEGKALRASQEERFEFQKWINKLDALREEVKRLEKEVLHLKKFTLYERARRWLNQRDPMRYARDLSNRVRRAVDYYSGARDVYYQDAAHMQQELLNPLIAKKDELTAQLDNCTTQLAPLTVQLGPLNQEFKAASIREEARDDMEKLLFDILQEAMKAIDTKRKLLIAKKRLEKEHEFQPII